LNECVSLDFPRYSPDITIKHLLTHTSGIPDYYDEEKITDFASFALSIPCYELRGPTDYLPAFPDEDMKFPPGERFSYCNGGYILLGLVIEALTGMRYQDFVEQTIFQPTGMHRSGYFAMNQLPEQTALGYIEDDGTWRTNIFNRQIVGASDGGAFTRVGDLATLWTAFWQGTIVPPEVVEIYTAPYVHAETEGEHMYYGHGLWIREDAHRTRDVYMVGGDAGVSFKSRVDRTNDLHVTVMSNTTHGAWPVVRAIARAVQELIGAAA
jgi:CubicO group peptidase (beta-lactamase class C family)